MLNARPEFVKAESHIIAQAGLPGTVTIATRMAGRGTDILLGGNSKGLVESTLFSHILRKCAPDLKQSSAEPIVDMDSNEPAVIEATKMVSVARAQVAEDRIKTPADAEKLMNRVISLAEGLRSEVLHDLRYTANDSLLDFRV